MFKKIAIVLAILLVPVLLMGAEIGILANFLKVRGGFHQGYPTVGAGISLAILHLDYAHFTRELGNAPGLFPESTHRIQLVIGF